MKVVVVNGEERIVISAEEIKELNLKPSDKLLIDVRENAIILRPLPKPVKVRANREWGEEAFLKVGGSYLWRLRKMLILNLTSTKSNYIELLLNISRGEWTWIN